jgi:hypothetical protein
MTRFLIRSRTILILLALAYLVEQLYIPDIYQTVLQALLAVRVWIEAFRLLMISGFFVFEADTFVENRPAVSQK